MCSGGDVRLLTLSESSRYRSIRTRSVTSIVLAQQRRRNGTETWRRRSCRCEHLHLITHEKTLLNGDVPRRNGTETWRRRSCQCEHLRLITHEKILLNGRFFLRNGSFTRHKMFWKSHCPNCIYYTRTSLEVVSPYTLWLYCKSTAVSHLRTYREFPAKFGNAYVFVVQVLGCQPLRTGLRIWKIMR